jgi:hypothetical protein
MRIDFKGFIDFQDGKRASTILSITDRRIRLNVEAEGVVNHEVWDRSKVDSIVVHNVREEQYMVRLRLEDGKEKTLPVILDSDDAQRLAAAL